MNITLYYLFDKYYLEPILAIDGENSKSNACDEKWRIQCRSQNKTCHVDDEDVVQCGSCLFGYQPIDGKCLRMYILFTIEKHIPVEVRFISNFLSKEFSTQFGFV